MFAKGFVVFGLLALFACQSVTGSSYDVESRATLPELIAQVEDLIKNLSKLVGGVLGDATSMLKNLLATIGKIKEKFLDDGIKVITDTIGDAVGLIKDIVQDAAELGFDVSKCAVGSLEQLAKLQSELIGTVTKCVTDIVADALKMVNNDLKIVKEMVDNITSAPLKLSKCLISLRPITCLTNLIANLASALVQIPGQVTSIINEAMTLVDNLPGHLLGCVKDIAASVVKQTTEIVGDVTKCADDITGGGKSNALVTRVTRGIVDDIKNIIVGLNKLVSGVLGDALKTLGNLVKVITSLKEKFLKEGIGAITNIIGGALGYIKNMTELGVKLGIDFGECLGGRVLQVEKLGEKLIGTVTKCVGDTASQVLVMVNKDLKVVQQMVGNITNAPVKLAACLINLRPIKCLTNLLGDLTHMLANIPGQIIEIVENAAELVEALPVQLLGCVNTIVSTATTDTQAIIKEIGNCIDNLISQNTGAPTNKPTAAPTAAPTVAPPGP